MSAKLSSIPQLTYEEVDELIEAECHFFETVDLDENLRYFHGRRHGLPEEAFGNVPRYMIQVMNDIPAYDEDEEGYVKLSPISIFEGMNWTPYEWSDDQIDAYLSIGKYGGLALLT